MSHHHTCTKVSLLKRPYSSGRISLYLDFYPPVRIPGTMKTTRREYLGLYLIANPHNEMERDYNETIMERAEAIRCLRVTSFVNEQFGFLDHEKLRGDFLAYFKGLCRKKNDKWITVYKHFENYVKGKCTFGDITVNLCNGFKDYLLKSATNLRLTHRAISQNSSSGYYSTFRAALKQAYLDKYLKENINDYLESIDTKDVKKEYLTIDELKILASTPCKIPVLKQASLFACLTGLRISDILKLSWEEIRLDQDGGYSIHLRTQKTQTEAVLPISQEALEVCGEKGTGIVFKGLQRSMTNYPLKQWITEAGITKHITFHCFRHTYATLQIASGTDIYTVSKMLTHRNVSTTQIYADLVSEKKRDTVNKISLK